MASQLGSMPLSMLESAPVVNYGYYDVPINNEFSNKEYRSPPIDVTQYDLNQTINLKNNNNSEQYIVAQNPVRPSPSLYTESDVTSAYYNPSNANPRFSLKKKEMDYNYENFTGNSALDNYNYLNSSYSNSPQCQQPPMNSYTQYYGSNPVNPAYLNTQMMPNVPKTFIDHNIGFRNEKMSQERPQLMNQPHDIGYFKSNANEMDPNNYVKIEDSPINKYISKKIYRNKKDKKDKKMKKRSKKPVNKCSNLYKVIYLLSVIILLFILQNVYMLYKK